MSFTHRHKSPVYGVLATMLAALVLTTACSGTPRSPSHSTTPPLPIGGDALATGPLPARRSPQQASTTVPGSAAAGLDQPTAPNPVDPPHKPPARGRLGSGPTTPTAEPPQPAVMRPTRSTMPGDPTVAPVSTAPVGRPAEMFIGDWWDAG